MLYEYYTECVCKNNIYKIIFEEYKLSKYGFDLQCRLDKIYESMESIKLKEGEKKINIFYFICRIFHYSIYKLIINEYMKLTDKIYTYVEQNINQFTTFVDRLPNLYLKEINCCSKNVVDEIMENCGYEIAEVIEQIGNINIERICTGYIKYQSNYKTAYYSTNLYGDVRVDGKYNEPYGKIYLLSACRFSGYVVADSDNIGSSLQKELIKRGYKYQVINMGMSGVQAFEQYRRLLDMKIQEQDIIIIDTDKLYIKGIDNISVDLCKVDKMVEGKTWYWDAPGHCSALACNIIGKEMIEQIDLKKNDECIIKAFQLEEYARCQLKDYLENIKNIVSNNKKWKDYNSIGAIVMNCNPFTYGHKYLIETASRLVEGLFVFVVEEDKSVFSFKDRYKMVKTAIENLENVIVLPSGKFMISTLTFGGYFQKDNVEKASYDSFYDLKIFSEYIAPSLNIKKRFVGEEPFDRVTAQYNKDMKVLLENIDIIEIPRLKLNDRIVNATYIRKCLEKNDWNEVSKYVPLTTLNVLKNI